MKDVLPAKKKVIIGLILIIAVAAIYGKVAGYGFIDFDDNIYITKNPMIQKGLTTDGLSCAFTACAFTESIAIWHPLTWVSWLIDYRLYGLNPGGYHVTNVLFHIANTLLIFLILNRITRAPWRSALVSALFALHPLHVESVAWVAERKDVLSAFFGLLATGAYIVYTERPRVAVYLLVVLMFACSLMAKPMLVTLPFVFLLLDFWPLGRWAWPPIPVLKDLMPPSAMKRETPEGKRMPKRVSSPVNGKNNIEKPERSYFLRCLVEKIPLMLITAIFSLVTYVIHKAQGSVDQIIPLAERLGNALVSYAAYIVKMIVPVHLAVFYPYRDDLTLLPVIGSALILILITTVVLFYARRMPYLFVGWFFYLGTMVPVVGIIQVGQQAMADRYTYVPLIGLFINIVWGFYALVSKWRYAKALSIAAAVTVIAPMILLSWVQIGYWKNSISLFRHTLEATRNNHLAHACLAVALQREGNFEEALFHFQEAVRIKPAALYLTDLGSLYGMVGKTDEAIACLRQALQEKENLERAQYNLGILLIARGEDQEALTHLLRTLQLNPRKEGTRLVIGNIMIRQGKSRDAVRYFEDEAVLGSKNALLYNDLGTVYYQLGQREKGLACYNRALAIEPENRLVKDNMKLALAKYGRPNTRGSCP
jgi:protein O-mannosyl-transferase